MGDMAEDAVSYFNRGEDVKKPVSYAESAENIRQKTNRVNSPAQGSIFGGYRESTC
jgi:hypothetical protein